MTTRIELVMLQKDHGRRRRAWRESSTLSSTCGRLLNRWWAPGSRKISARSGASKTAVGSFRLFVSFLADAPRRLEQIADQLEAQTRSGQREGNCKNRSRTHSPGRVYLCFDWIFASAPVLWRPTDGSYKGRASGLRAASTEQRELRPALETRRPPLGGAGRGPRPAILIHRYNRAPAIPQL